MADQQICSLQQVRKALGLSQPEMAGLLDISVRAVQSYEQGWRRCPSYIQKLALMFLFLRNNRPSARRTCWQVNKCPPDRKRACPGKGFGRGQLCWIVPGTHCHGRVQKNWTAKVSSCSRCPVIAHWLPQA